MPTRAELEEALGKRWAEMAHHEGHRQGVPKGFIASKADSDARADVILRHLRQSPYVSVRTLASTLKTTTEDISTRLNHLVRRGDIKLKNGRYEVIQ